VAQGQWVENKQVIGHVNQARLSLNIFELLRRVRACGSDFQFSPLTPGAGAPSVLIEGMQVG
jgi:predicted Zn-dependent protease